MAQIGDTDEERVKVYAVNKADDPPSSDSAFTDYTGFFTEWVCKGEINKLAQFEGTAIDINTTTKRGNGLSSSAATLSNGNLLYVMSGTKLIGKFVIQKPVFKTDFTVKLTGVQSTGTEKLNRKLANETAPARNYKDITFNTILTSTSSTCQGLLVDGSENTILNSTVSSGADDVYSIDVDYQNRMQAVDELVNIAGKEWWVNHGTNDSTPYDDGDTLYVDDRKGTSVSSKTFYFEGSDTNAEISEGGEEVETNANHIIMEGQDQTNRQITSEAADFSGMYSCITEGLTLDGWLAEDIDAGACRIPLTDNSFKIMRCCWLDSICCGGIRIDDEYIAFCNLIYDGGVPNLCVGGPSAQTFYPHKKGSDVIWVDSRYESNPGVWSLAPLRIYVDDVNCFCTANPHLIQVGSETFRYYNCTTSCGCWEPGADYVVALREEWQNGYAHGDKIIVREGGRCAGCALDSWHPANPDNQLNFNTLAGYSADETITGGTSGSTATVVDGRSSAEGYTQDSLWVCEISGDFCCGENINGSVTGNMGTLCMPYYTNSIQQNGLYSKTLSSNVPQTKHMLDLKTQRILQTKRLPIKRISISPIEAIDAWGDVDLGDTVTLGDGADVGFTDNVEVRVTGFEYKFGGGFIKLKFICNDNETRTYSSSMNPNYVGEKVTSEQSKQQEPLRSYNKVFSSSECCGNYSTWSEGLKRLTDVMDPANDYDAVNKKYVDDATAGAGIWTACDSGTYIYPACTSYCVLPGSVTQQLGSSSCNWYCIYGDRIVADDLCVNDSVCTDLVPYINGGEMASGICLGSPAYYWDTAYVYNLRASSICTDIISVNGIIMDPIWQTTTAGVRTIYNCHLFPRFCCGNNLGCSGCRWNYLYATNVDLSADLNADEVCANQSNICCAYSDVICADKSNICCAYSDVIDADTISGSCGYFDYADAICLCASCNIYVGNNIYLENDIYPNSDCTSSSLGFSTRYFRQLYANYVRYKDLDSFESHDDLSLIKNIKPKQIKRSKGVTLDDSEQITADGEEEIEVWDPKTMPEQTRKDGFYDSGAVNGLLIGAMKQLTEKVEKLEKANKK